MSFLQNWKLSARRLKREAYTLYLVGKDRRVPWYARLLAGVVVAYAFSPIDLIPDFIPILGYLDDLVLVPLGIALVLQIIPPDRAAECRANAEALIQVGKPVNRVAAVVIILIWLLISAWLMMKLFFQG